MTAVLLVEPSHIYVGVTSNKSKLLEFGGFFHVLEQFFHVAGASFTPLELKEELWIASSYPVWDKSQETKQNQL